MADFSRRFPKHIGYGAVVASMGLNLGLYNGVAVVWRHLTPFPEARTAADFVVCDPNDLWEAIAPIRNADAIVMTELDFAPMVLYLSPHLRTVSAGYIRNTQGVRDVLAFFRAHSDDAAHAILERRGVKFVLICDTGQKERLEVFKERVAHDTPAWLEPVGSSDAQSGFRLYRVRPGER